MTRRAIELAKNGDPTVLRLGLERVLPKRPGLPISVDIPPVETTADVVAASAALLSSVAQGLLSPSEGQSVARVLEGHRRAMEMESLEGRITELENRLREKGP